MAGPDVFIVGMRAEEASDVVGQGHGGRPTGTVVISVDAELGWGHHDLDSPPPERIEYARTGWLRLLSLFEEFDLPATWAVVGHLYLDSCEDHAGHTTGPEWFAREYEEWADRPDLRFGRSLIERIESADQPHEVGCHSFSHVEFGRDSVNYDLAVDELRESERAAGRPFDSFVFPRNSYGHRAALAECDYMCYRGPRSDEEGSRSIGRRGAKLHRGLVGAPPPLVTPHVDEFGLVNLPASMYLFDFEGSARTVVELAVGDPVVRRVRNGIAAAAGEPGILHLWLHPNNIYLERHVRRLRGIFSTIHGFRNDGHLTVETMREVAARIV